MNSEQCKPKWIRRKQSFQIIDIAYVVEMVKKNPTLQGRIDCLDCMPNKMRCELLYGNLSHLPANFVEDMREAELQRKIIGQEKKTGYPPKLVVENGSTSNIMVTEETTTVNKTFETNEQNTHDSMEIGNQLGYEGEPEIHQKPTQSYMGLNRVAQLQTTIRKNYDLSQSSQISSFISKNKNNIIRALGIDIMPEAMRTLLIGGYFSEIRKSEIKDITKDWEQITRLKRMINSNSIEVVNVKFRKPRKKNHDQNSSESISSENNDQIVKKKKEAFEITKIAQIIKTVLENPTLEGRKVCLGAMNQQLRFMLLNGDLTNLPHNLEHDMHEAELERIEDLKQNPVYPSMMFSDQMAGNNISGTVVADKNTLTNQSDSEECNVGNSKIGAKFDKSLDMTKVQLIQKTITENYKLTCPKEIRAFLVNNKNDIVRILAIDTLSKFMRQLLLGGFLRLIPMRTVIDLRRAWKMRSKIEDKNLRVDVFLQQTHSIPNVFQSTNSEENNSNSKTVHNPGSDIAMSDELNNLVENENKMATDPVLVPVADLLSKAIALKNRINFKNPSNIRDYFLEHTSAEERQIGLRALSRLDRNRLLRGDISIIPPMVVEEIRELNAKLRSICKIDHYKDELGSSEFDQDPVSCASKSNDTEHLNPFMSDSAMSTVKPTIKPIAISLADNNQTTPNPAFSLDSSTIPIDKTHKFVEEHSTSNSKTDPNPSKDSVTPDTSALLAPTLKKKMKTKLFIKSNIAETIVSIGNEIIEQGTPIKSSSNSTEANDSDSNEEVIDVTPAVPSVDLTDEILHRNLLQNNTNLIERKQPLCDATIDSTVAKNRRNPFGPSKPDTELPLSTKSFTSQILETAIPTIHTEDVFSPGNHNEISTQLGLTDKTGVYLEPPITAIKKSKKKSNTSTDSLAHIMQNNTNLIERKQPLCDATIDSTVAKNRRNPFGPSKPDTELPLSTKSFTSQILETAIPTIHTEDVFSPGNHNEISTQLILTDKTGVYLEPPITAIKKSKKKSNTSTDSLAHISTKSEHRTSPSDDQSESEARKKSKKFKTSLDESIVLMKKVKKILNKPDPIESSVPPRAKAIKSEILRPETASSIKDCIKESKKKQTKPSEENSPSEISKIKKTSTKTLKRTRLDKEENELTVDGDSETKIAATPICARDIVLSALNTHIPVATDTFSGNKSSSRILPSNGDPVLQRMKDIDDRMMLLQQEKMQIDEIILRHQQQKMTIEQNVMQLQNERIQLLGNLLSGQTPSSADILTKGSADRYDSSDSTRPASKKRKLGKRESENQR